jgi:outer membrane receptor protein involved in Fe transport
MKRSFFTLFAMLLLVFAAIPVAAQEQTAAVEGMVMDQSGAALPGATVEAVSARGQRFTTQSDSNGRYRFPSVPPGVYTVTASLSGMEPASARNLEVKLGSSPRVDLRMRIGAVTEAVTVTAEAPLVDVTSSAANTSIRREVFEDLPKGRDFSSIVTFAAGARQEDMTGGISIDGASGSENRYIVDGVDTTDPQTGVQGKRVVTDFVDEVQVKSSGYEAQFGGATGGVVNAVTRTGTNDFRGDINAYYSDSGLGGGSARPTTQRDPNNADAPVQFVTYEKDEDTFLEPGLSIGGPILRDRLWFFGGYQPEYRDITRTVTHLNDNRTLDWDQERTRQLGTANLTGNLGSRLTFKAAANFSPTKQEGTLPLVNGTQGSTGDYGAGFQTENEAYSGYLDFIATSSLLFSARGGQFTTDYEDLNVPVGINHRYRGNPATYQTQFPGNTYHASGFNSLGPAIVERTETDLYSRRNLSLDTSYFTSAFLGQHAFRGGIQLEKVKNEVVSGEVDSIINYNFDRTYATTKGESVRGTFGHFVLRRFLTIGEVEQESTGFFLQDTWTVNNRLTLNLGVRTEKEEVPSYVSGAPPAISFDYGDKLAPRLGFAYDLFGSGRTKVYGSFGTFYDITKLEMPRGSFGGDKWVDYFYTLDSLDIFNLNANCRIGAGTIDVRPTCGAGRFIEALDRRFVSSDPAALDIDPNLKPMESREYSIGGQHQLTDTFAVGLRYVHKEIIRTIEDVGVLEEGQEHFFIANPGEGIARFILAEECATCPAMPKPVRDYDGVELELTKRFTSRWGIHATYLWSRLYGNYTGLSNADEYGGGGAAAARTSPNVTRLFDGLAQAFDAEGNAVYGLLPTDRTHSFKSQLTYRAPFGTTLGYNQTLESGVPNSTEMTVAPGLPFFPYGRNDLGRYGARTQADIFVAHAFKIGGRNELQVGVNVLNLFDEDAEGYRWNRVTQDDIALTPQEFFQGFDPAAEAAATGAPDPRFNQPLEYQAPRSVRLSVKLRF